MVSDNLLCFVTISADGEHLSWITTFSTLGDVFSNQHVDPASCFQKFVCSAVKNASFRTQTGNSSSSDKILDGLATNDVLNYFIQGTFLHEPVKNGLSDGNCSEEYFNCKWDQRMIQKLLEKLVN